MLGVLSQGCGPLVKGFVVVCWARSVVLLGCSPREGAGQARSAAFSTVRTAQMAAAARQRPSSCQLLHVLPTSRRTRNGRLTCCHPTTLGALLCHAPLLVHVRCIGRGGVVSVVPLVRTQALDLRGSSCRHRREGGRFAAEPEAAACGGPPPVHRQARAPILPDAQPASRTCAHRGRLPPGLHPLSAEGGKLPARKGALQWGEGGGRLRRAL